MTDSLIPVVSGAGGRDGRCCAGIVTNLLVNGVQMTGDFSE